MKKSCQIARLASLGSLFLLLTAGCATRSMQPEAPKAEQCHTGERYICVGGSASKLETETNKDFEICRCGQLSDLPQVH